MAQDSKAEFAWMYSSDMTTEKLINGLKCGSMARLRRHVEELASNKQGRYLLGDLLIVLVWDEA